MRIQSFEEAGKTGSTKIEVLKIVGAVRTADTKILLFNLQTEYVFCRVSDIFR